MRRLFLGRRRCCIAFKLSVGDYECVKELNGVTTALRLFFCEHGACSLETWHDLVCSTVEDHAVLLQNTW